MRYRFTRFYTDSGNNIEIKKEKSMEEMTRTQAYADLLALRKMIVELPKEKVLEVIDEKLKAYENVKKSIETK